MLARQSYGTLLGMAAVVAGGAALGWQLSRGLEAFLPVDDFRAKLAPCFEIGVPFHHRLRANCSETLPTPRGMVSFSTNEDGLRDAERAQILKFPHRVLVLGDSNVEGWWASATDSIPSLLAGQMSDIYFVNAGVRGAGALQQAARLAPLLNQYRPERILWLFDDANEADDRLACSLLRDSAAPAERMQFATDDFALEEKVAWLAGKLGNSLVGSRLRQWAYARRRLALLQSPSAKRCGPCRGIQELARMARAQGISLLAVSLLLPEGASYEGKHSPGDVLRACLDEARVPQLAVDFRSRPVDGARDLFWGKDLPLTPEGVVATVNHITPAIRAWLKSPGASPNRSRDR